MADLWDAEFKEVDRVRAASNLVALILAVLAGFAGWGWWSLAVFLGALSIGVWVVKRIEHRYDRIRLEIGFRRDEEMFGLGWDTKEEAKADLASTPRYWRETHCVTRYFNKEGKQRWGVCNKPKYWRDREAQMKIWDQYPPTKEEQEIMERKRYGR